MLQEIKNQIDNINKSIAWIKKNRPSDYNQRFLQLVEGRRALKRIEAAAANNPGIAAFGKSQVGKSYLIGCLLQGRDAEGKELSFKVKAGQQSYDFVLNINPPSDEGGGKESTGVVSRFSSFKRDESIYNNNLPVLVKMFTVSDIILILSDSYFNDFCDYSTPSDAEIKELYESWEASYGNMAIINQGKISADDILNIKTYFKAHINNAQAFNNSAIFDRLALLIDRIPLSDYAGVFSCLWNNEQIFTNLFDKLLKILQRFKFSDKLYLPIESVLHQGIKENTIMSVQCLKQLLKDSEQYFSDVYLCEDGRYEKCGVNVRKSEICAICSEVIYKIDNEFLTSSRPYKYENMDKSVQSIITHEDVKMEMLADNDLLDFPGAKSREQEELSKVSPDNILDFFLRGKVAYLFNKYNEEMGINILLYCHHNKDNDVTYLYKLLEDWVKNYVGDSAEARRRKIAITKKSPLFYIGTMFNLDMKFGLGTEMTEKSIDQRWKGRFETVVYNQCFHQHTADWVKNWTAHGEDFNNSYVLRDYKFSTDLYDGFEQSGHETGSKMSDTYFKMMRKTFIENEHVRRLFANPAVSWDVAATQENDGALYIIQNLTEVAARMDMARESDFREKLHKVQADIYKTMQDYYVSGNLDELLETNIRKARAIFREMDFTCNNDNYYFGHLLQALQLTEKESYAIVHKVMQSPDLNAKVNDFKAYELIRKSCENAGYPIESVKSEEDRWQCLMKTYAFGTQEEAQDYLNKKNVDSTKLFTGTYKRKLNSCVIADNVFDAWCSSIKSVDFINEFTDEQGFDISVMTSLMDNLVNASENLGLRDLMAECIAEYVNVVDIHTANESLLADMLASKVNEFVMDFGFRYLTDEAKAKAQKICENHNLPAFRYILKQLPSTYDEKDLTALFNDMSTSPKALLPSFEDNYNKWIEYMFISFVANLDIPDIDFEANKALAIILDQLKAGNLER